MTRDPFSANLQGDCLPFDNGASEIGIAFRQFLFAATDATKDGFCNGAPVVAALESPSANIHVEHRFWDFERTVSIVTEKGAFESSKVLLLVGVRLDKGALHIFDEQGERIRYELDADGQRISRVPTGWESSTRFCAILDTEPCSCG